MANKSTFTVTTTPTLGERVYINISAESSDFYHEVYVTTEDIGIGESVGIKDGSGSFSVPTKIEWASKFPNSTKAKVTISIETYTGINVFLGTTSKTVYLPIPEDIVPTCNLSVKDATDYKSEYGSYVKGLSQLKIDVAATEAYKSPITSYEITVGNSVYTTSSATVDTSNLEGEVTITAKVTDGRGRTATSSTKITVIERPVPNISKLTVHRCNSDGTENIQGEYCLVTFSAGVLSAFDDTTVDYVLKYKKTADADYSEVTLYDLQNNVSVTDETYIFEAYSGSAYDVVLSVSIEDAFAEKSTKLSTGFSLMHFHKNGTSIGIGKVAEEENLLDVALDARFNGRLEFSNYLPNMRVLHNKVGKFFDSEDGTVEGVGIVTITTYLNGIVRLDFSVKIIKAGTASTTKYGLNWDLIREGYDDLPETVTPFNGGTWIQIKEDGTVRYESNALGNFVAKSGNRWALGVVKYGSDGATPSRQTYYETFCTANRIIQGTCYGYFE